MIMLAKDIKSSKVQKKIELVYSGEDYFSRLEKIINTTKKELHIQTYIFDTDSTGLRIIDSLIKAANRNVKVYLLLDGFGSSSFSSNSVKNLRYNGINVRFFSPILSLNSFYIGRRLHHKVVVSDGKKLLIGGINIADKYHGSSFKTPWLDYAIEIESAVAKPIQQICRNFYFKKRKVRKSKIEATLIDKEPLTIRILQNDWLNRKNEVHKEYIKAIGNAQKEIIIVGSYFFPGRRIALALKKASKRKIPIKLIVSGISDVPVLRSASLYLYSILLKYNIEIYEWNKSVLHGKAAVIDGKWTTVGSFNINNLSSFGSIEMNVEINSTSFSEKYLLHLNKIINQCSNLTIESLKNRDGKFTKYSNLLSYLFIRFVVIIMTYFPRNRFLKFFR
jgi:cardiolipin synthase